MATAIQNGETVAEKVPGLLDNLHAEYLRKGGKVGKDRKPLSSMPPLMKAWRAASKARDAAEAEFLAAKEAECQCVAAIIRSVGKGRLKIEGSSYIPMSRGESVYLRQEGGGDSLDLG